MQCMGNTHSPNYVQMMCIAKLWPKFRLFFLLFQSAIFEPTNFRVSTSSQMVSHCHSAICVVFYVLYQSTLNGRQLEEEEKTTSKTFSNIQKVRVERANRKKIMNTTKRHGNGKQYALMRFIASEIKSIKLLATKNQNANQTMHMKSHNGRAVHRGKMRCTR